ncbi:hypothetical protein HRbin29_01583 [bacterium HR29]|jgi:DME family drug/metabolite transporter|nr:hypothetical protein HRbin29_01583 [bacterium HR29]
MALTAAFLWAITSTMLRALGQAASPLWIGVVRLWVASAFILLVATVLGDAMALPGITPGAAAAVAGSGILAYAAGDTLYIRALARFGMGSVFPATMSGFIGLTVLGGVVLLGEPFTPGLGVGGAAIVAGVWLLTRGREPVAVSGGGAAGASRWEELAFVGSIAALWTAATLWLTWGQGDLPPLAVGAVRTPVAAIALTLLAVAADRNGAGQLVGNWRLLVGAATAGLVGTGVGSLLYILALQDAGAARTAVLSSTSPVWGLPLAILVLGERATPARLAGTALAVGGAMAVAVL